MTDIKDQGYSYSNVVEVGSVPVSSKHDREDESLVVRVFQLTLNGVTVEVTSLGACVSRWLIPSFSDDTNKVDDIVLGYASPLDMWETNNPDYLGVVAGRVANRQAQGKLHLNDQIYQLECNNGPNHLHGGLVGFSRRIWDATIVPCGDDGTGQGVEFELVSPDGDQGYPASVKVTARYCLRSSLSSRNAVALCLKLKAELLRDDSNNNTLYTPINLVQHSYFNLSSHNEPRGILDHKLTLHCDTYTPVDDTSIPTREVRSVSNDPVFDFTQGRVMKEALKQYGIVKAGLTEQEAERTVTTTPRVTPNVAVSKPAGLVVGYDHNFVVRQTADNKQGGLFRVAVLEHESSRRKLTVRSDAPGVQVYSGNFLNGSLERCKENAVYGQWQSLCLETQHFPDSISGKVEDFPEFAKGRCVILRPDQPIYEHTVEYEVSFE